MEYVLFAVGLFGLGWFVPHLIIEKMLKVGPRAHSRFMANPKKGNV